MERKIDRFLQYLEYKGITENKATVDCGLSKGLINQAKNGKSDLGNKAVEKVLIFYQDLNKVWLLTGEGEMLNSDQPEDSMAEQPEPDTSLVEYLKRKVAELEGKVEKLTDEKADLLQQNAVLKYENQLLAPQKGRNAEDAESSLSVSAAQ